MPPNWDSWGKIRVLRDGFDVERVSEGWSIDLDQPFPTVRSEGTHDPSQQAESSANGTGEPEGSAVALYEEQVQDTSLETLQLAQGHQDTSRLEVPSVDTQAFLANQLERLEQQKKADEKAGKDNSFTQSTTDAVISDHIGPVQFNVGGIQVDADDMVQRLRVSCSFTLFPFKHPAALTHHQDHQAYRSSPEPQMDDESQLDEGTAPVDTDTLAKFFGNLMNRKPTAGGGVTKT